MAIKVISNYAKRLGLPGYSSHQFSVSVETELTDLEALDDQLSRLYSDLQQAVDREIQQTGFVPGDNYGNGNQPGNRTPARSNGGNGGNGVYRHNNGGNGASNGNTAGGVVAPPVTWNCSEKQRGLIERLVREHDLAWAQLEKIAADRFGVVLAQLNRLQASGLIGELIESFGNRKGKGGTR